MTIVDIPKAPEGSVYIPSRKRKQVASESEKVVQKPPKRKVVQLIDVQKEVQEISSTSVLMSTKTRSGATGKTSQKATTYELSIKKKKLRKMVLPDVDDNNKEEDEQPLVKRTKVMNKDALNIPTKDVQKGATLIVTALISLILLKFFRRK